MKPDRNFRPAVVTVKGVFCSVAFSLNMAHDHSLQFCGSAELGLDPRACALDDSIVALSVDMVQLAV